MLNLIKSLLAGLLAALFFKVTFVDSIWALIFPFLIAAVAVYFYLARKNMRELEVLVQKVQVDLQSLSPTSSPKERQDAIDRAVAVLKTGLAMGKQQFMVASQIHGQIGQLYYVQQNYKDARPHLEQSFSRNWIARAMLACIQFKEKEYEAMKKTFEDAVKGTDKESLLWNVYAWCVWKSGDRDGAQLILGRAAKLLPKDEKIKKNLHSLQNNNQIKMRGWNEMWYQFHLEPIPHQDLEKMFLEQRNQALQQQQQQAQKHKMDRRAMRGR